MQDAASLTSCLDRPRHRLLAECVRISIVIPVYNNAGTLRACLEAVTTPHPNVAEIVVVNDGSTDGSLAIAKEAPVVVIDLAEHMGVSYARNTGARSTIGNYLFFTDGDVIISDDTIDRALAALAKHPEAAAVLGSYRAECGAKGFVSACKNLMHHYSHQTCATKSSSWFCACGLIRREAFEQVGRFDESKSCLEDIDIGYRLYKAGYVIIVEPQMQVTHCKRYGLFSLIYADLTRRAIPWMQLNLEHGMHGKDMCTQRREVVRVCIAGLTVVSAFAALGGVPGSWAVLGLTIGAFAVSNAGFLAYARSHRGLSFALASFPMVYLRYFIAGVGAPIGIICHGAVRFRAWIR